MPIWSNKRTAATKANKEGKIKMLKAQIEAEKPVDSDDEHLARVPPPRKENPEDILRR